MDEEHQESWQKRVWDLYDQAWDEEKFFLNEFHRRVAFFGGLSSALLAATIGGAMKASSSLHFLLLAAGPALIFSLSGLAITALSRPYQRFLEAITKKAKLEHEMLMTEKRRSDGNWVEAEALVPDRHLQDRLYRKPRDPDSPPFLSSRDFVDYRLRHGSQAVFRRFFRLLQVVSIALLFGFAWLAMHEGAMGPADPLANEAMHLPVACGTRR